MTACGEPVYQSSWLEMLIAVVLAIITVGAIGIALAHSAGYDIICCGNVETCWR